MEKWQIIDNSKLVDSTDWIEEEEKLIQWTENMDFSKYPLDTIATTFFYIDKDAYIVGKIKTECRLLKQPNFSVLSKHELMERVDKAKRPDPNWKWLQKKYDMDGAIIYNIMHKNDNIDQINTDSKNVFVPIVFSSEETIKIPNSIVVFHDLYEIVILMREVKPDTIKLSSLGEKTAIKSIIKTSEKTIKTKKVRISDTSPEKHVYMENRPITRSRKTRRIIA